MEYEKLLSGFRREQGYLELRQTVNAELKEWIALDLEPVRFLRECVWEVDDAVFFNTTRSKGYLLLLVQDHAKGSESDYVYVMYANKVDNKWEVFFEGLPNLVFPRDRFGHRQLSLSQLSQHGRAALLPAYLRNGQPNNVYVGKPDLAELRKRHLKFLKQR